MSFKLLKQVLFHLKKKAACPNCQSSFDDNAIFVLATNILPLLNGTSGLFFVVCPRCRASAFVMAEIINVAARLKKKHVFITTKAAAGVSTNEILDMHNFLKNFGGDMKELFKEK